MLGSEKDGTTKCLLWVLQKKKKGKKGTTNHEQTIFISFFCILNKYIWTGHEEEEASARAPRLDPKRLGLATTGLTRVRTLLGSVGYLKNFFVSFLIITKFTNRERLERISYEFLSEGEKFSFQIVRVSKTYRIGLFDLREKKINFVIILISVKITPLNRLYVFVNYINF